jgi:hypothetical protein
VSTRKQRGACPVCGFRFRLRKDGTMQAHWLYGSVIGSGYCEGAGMQPDHSKKQGRR